MSDCSLRYCLGGWFRGCDLAVPARDRTTARLMRFVDAGFAEHEVRPGHKLGSRHHYYRATDAAREAVRHKAADA